jgi:hypothetical protein
MAPEPVTTSIWLEQQLQRALERLDKLDGDVEQLRHALRTSPGDSGHDRHGLAQLLPDIDPQIALYEALEQVRTLRERVEVRLTVLEGRVAESSRQQSQLLDERALLRRELVDHETQIRDLLAALEVHREVLIEHVRRATAAAEEAGRRQMQEIDRQARAGRELLRQLSEQSDASAKEQPL